MKGKETKPDWMATHSTCGTTKTGRCSVYCLLHDASKVLPRTHRHDCIRLWENIKKNTVFLSYSYQMEPFYTWCLGTKFLSHTIQFKKKGKQKERMKETE